MDVANRLVIGTKMAGPLTCSNWGSFPAGREKCSAGACPQPGEGWGHRRHLTLPSTNAPNFHALVCRHQPAWAIGAKMMLRGLDPECPAPNSSFRRRPESRGEGWHQPHPNTFDYQVSLSYLGVPAPAGMSDWYERMSRTPIRDEFRHRPATPTAILVATTAENRIREM